MYAIVVLTIGLVCILPGYMAKFWRWQKQWRYERLRNSLTAKLEVFGSLLVTNLKGGVLGICNARVFGQALHDIELAREFHENPYKKIVLYIKPTFTFAGSEEILRPIHTGTRRDLEEIMRKLICNLLENKYNAEIKGDMLEHLAKVITQRDARLFVPYVGDKPVPEWDQYGSTTNGEAHVALIMEILDSTA